MKSTKKYCPSCHHRFLVDPSISPSACPRCKNEYEVNPSLRDTDRTRGGFTISHLYKENEFQNKLLEFISENPGTRTNNIVTKLRSPPSTIRSYIRKLESEGLIIVDSNRKSHRFTCSQKYVPTKKPAPAEMKICVSCKELKYILRNRKCAECVAIHDEINETFRRLSQEAEHNFNVLQYYKNRQVTA